MMVGFDIGGTNTRVAALTDAGIGPVSRIPTLQDPKAHLLALGSLIKKVSNGVRIERCVVSVPGTLRGDGTIVSMSNLPAWEGFAFGSEFSRHLHVPLKLEHDASLGALGEAVHGAGKGANNVAYFGIGTGLGVGHAVGGAIRSPSVGFEAGHQIIDAGRHVQLTNLVSGKSIAQRSGVSPKDAPRALYDELTPILAVGIFNTALHWLPDVFVLGGSLMNEENGYRLADVVKSFHALPLEYFETIPDIRAGALGDDANLHGARALLFQ